MQICHQIPTMDKFKVAITTPRAVCRSTILVLLVLCPLVAMTAPVSHPDLDRILRLSEPPDGVVIEVVSWDKTAWQWAAPTIQQIRKQLIDRFPGIDVVVVSHGAEQFQLTRQNLASAPELQSELAELSSQGVNFHVCGTHSQWNGVDESAYSALVDVSPSGPAQINDYKNLGYQVIILRRQPG